MTDEVRRARVDIGVPFEDTRYSFLSDRSQLSVPLGQIRSADAVSHEAMAETQLGLPPQDEPEVAQPAPEPAIFPTSIPTPPEPEQAVPARRVPTERRRWSGGRISVVAGLAVAALTATAFGSRVLSSDTKADTTAELTRPAPTHAISKQPVVQPTITTPQRHHHAPKPHAPKAVTTPTPELTPTPLPTPTPEATAPVVAAPPVRHPKPRKHKVTVALSDEQLVRQLSVQDEMSQLTTLVVPTIDQILPSYQSAAGALDLAHTSLGGVVLKNIQPGQEGLLESGLHELATDTLLPMGSFYEDDAIANPTSSLQLQSIQRMFQEGISLTKAKSLFATHYSHLADNGVKEVFVGADLPASYHVARQRVRTGTRIVHRHHHRRRVPTYKIIPAHDVAINQQTATQYVLAKVRSAQAAGLKVVSGAFPGASAASTTPNPYALVQQLGADMEVSAAGSQPAMAEPSAYRSLHSLNQTTELLTAPLTSPDGSAAALANLAVSSLIAGANQAIVTLPSGVTLGQFQAAEATAAQQAINQHKLGRSALDAAVLAHFRTEGVSAKSAVTTLNPHAKTVRYHWVRSKR